MDWHSESLVDAEVANRNHPFDCPNCWKEVTLAQGEINAAYFRHRDASPSCPDYHPGSGAYSHRIGHSDSRFVLRLARAEDKWTLYFKLPELQAKEMASVVSPRELVGLTVALQHHNGDITGVNALELWPGSGTSTVTVDPANQIRRTFTQGDWRTWDFKRWNNEVQDIPATGAVFAQDSGGDYVLCTGSRPLYLGRSAVFVAQEPASPPRWVESDKLESHQGFAAWHFVAPRATDTRYSQWLKKLGTTMAETRDPSIILTPPIEYRNDETHMIRSGDCAVIEPSSSAAAIVAQTSQEFQALKVGKTGQFVRLSGNFFDVHLRTRSGDDMHITGDDFSASEHPFGSSQLWGITIEGEVHMPYSAVEIDEIRALRIGVNTEIPLRFTATVQYPGKTVTRLSRVNREALQSWLAQIDSSAFSLEVDAGSFGLIRIISTRRSHQPADSNDRAYPTHGTPRHEAEGSGTRHTRHLSRNDSDRSQWSSAFIALRADDKLSRPYWALGGRRDSTQYWRIQR